MTVGSTLRLGGLCCIALFGAAIYWHSQPALLASVLFALALAIAKVRTLITTARSDEQAALRPRADPYLEPGESIQAAFVAVGGPGPYLTWILFVCIAIAWFAFGRQVGSWLMSMLIFSTTRWSVVATDRAILLFQRVGNTDRDVFVTRLSRYTRLGPVSGRWAMISLNGTWMFVPKHFHAEVELADSLVAWPETFEQSETPPRRAKHPVSLRSHRRRRGS